VDESAYSNQNYSKIAQTLIIEKIKQLNKQHEALTEHPTDINDVWTCLENTKYQSKEDRSISDSKKE